MAISFETVTGNQTSANVLAQINNNFAKINSTPVPKADFATNADTVDNKHASELIPGAATFLNSISTLANLSVGRYFCTQTRQSWEPVTTTGNRTFLIEVSLNTPNSLKSYKITYIAGAGAGESYYSDYSSGSIRWNRIINNNNVTSIDAVKNTYDENDNKGRITTYNDMIVYKEGTSLVENDFIQVNDGTGNYYRTSASFTFSRTSGSGCSATNYWNLKITIQIYDSSFNLLKTVTGTDEVRCSGSSSVTGTGHIIGQYINTTTGDMIIGAYGTTSNSYIGYDQGYFYFSTATNTCFFIPISSLTIIDYNSSGTATMLGISYWYNNYFGFVRRATDYSSSSAYSNIQIYYIDLTTNRGSVSANSNTTLTGGAYSQRIIGQKEQYLYIVINSSSYTSQPSLIRADITTRATQSSTIAVASTGSFPASCFGGIIDDDFIYFGISYYASSSKYKLFKYNLSLVLSASSSEITGSYSYIVGTDNYIAIFSSSSTDNVKCYTKSNLSLSSSYNTGLYISGYYNRNITVPNSGYAKWYNQNKYQNSIYGIPVFGDYILAQQTTTFYSGDSNSSYYFRANLYPIINISNSTVLGYFSNTINYSTLNEQIPAYIDGIGITFRKKILDTSKFEYLLKSFRRT